MKTLKINTPCSYHKSYVCVYDKRTKRTIMKNLTPIIGDLYCKKCRHNKGENEDKTLVLCDYSKK